MTAVPQELKNNERRQQVFLGPLPNDFLRLSVLSQEQQEAADQQAALALHQQLHMQQSGAQMQHMGRLSITVAQAKLVKNYGLTRMDPYVRLRVGHCVYETHTDSNGGKTPHWNKVIQCLLAQRVNSLYLEIYDECSFTMDELIAWAHIPIPQSVMSGETIDDWYPLSGKQGDNQEGHINLVLSITTAPLPHYAFRPTPAVAATPMVMVPTPMYGMQPAPVPVYTIPASAPVPQQQQLPQQQMPPAPTQEDFKMIEDMFPNMDKEVVRSVFEANRYNKEGTINSLLQMNE